MQTFLSDRGEDRDFGFEKSCLMERYFKRINKDYLLSMDKKVFDSYKDIVSQESRKTYAKFKNTFKNVGLELDDLENISRVYLVGYLGLYSLDNNPSAMAKFVDSFQRKNKTDNLPPKEIVLKKDRSNFISNLKQKLPMLADICRSKSTNIVCCGGYRKYLKIKDAKDIQIVSELKGEIIPEGYLLVTKREFLEAKKENNSKRKKKFLHKGFWYLAVSRDPVSVKSMFTSSINDLDYAMDAEDKSESEDVGFMEQVEPKYYLDSPDGIIQKAEDYEQLFLQFQRLTIVEKKAKLEKFLKSNRSRILAKAAHKMLETLENNAAI